MWPCIDEDNYKVHLAKKRINGQMTELSAAQTFEVIQMREPGLKGASIGQVVVFTRKLDDLSRQIEGMAVDLP